MQVERNFLTPNACIHRKKLSGGRVSNTWVTCLKEGDNTWKQVLIPYISKDRMILRRKMVLLSLLDGPAAY